MMQDEQLRPVLDRLLEQRRAKDGDGESDTSASGIRKGLRVLFTSHSGRNKLLAAQLFAHELSVDLYEFDLQRIVSKYIGETEKHLDDFFKAASDSDAVLLFDEADALFGKDASSVEESGQYPNLNLGLLRQRIESYNGVVLLGAHDRTGLDPKLEKQCDAVVALDDD
jgi:SpoVK/Ycf46/Vps4 family AAA+-type ATPase